MSDSLTLNGSPAFLHVHNIYSEFSLRLTPPETAPVFRLGEVYLELRFGKMTDKRLGGIRGNLRKYIVFRADIPKELQQTETKQGWSGISKIKAD